ncbi:actin binding protein [Tieghemostelium lacteum]|uniref:Actin binding protein n=1 Tax=Tieghemostelium lacteum TaxID=361077 RepID=A0A151Z947_TIELA|nr:actin binding protein [Tieghemostelium lacteum]|eukprot:KYQ90479.1 actin binding protein [Tieghemostelium lacteum]
MILTITFQVDPINNTSSGNFGPGGSGTLTRSQARASINVTTMQTQTGSKTYNLDQNSSYRTVFLAICQLFGITEQFSDDYILQVESTKKYLNWPHSSDESKNKQIVKYIIEMGESSLLLKFNPTYRSSKWVKALNESENNEKDIIFHLKYKLQEPEFAESFIEQNGMEGILRMVSTSKGNTQTYALGALRACLEYISGMDIITKTPLLIKQLFSLVDSSVVGVCRGALELLFVLCDFRKEEGFKSIHIAAKSIAQSQSKQAYQNIIKLLDSGDLETKINAFTLINVLLGTCPSNEKVTKLVKKFGDMGLHEKLRELTDIAQHEFQIQLEIYESTSGVNLRTKASRLEAIAKRLKAKVTEYEAQQPLITILKEELKLSQQLIREASTDRIFLNSHPMQRYLGPLNTQYPADLSFLKTTVMEKEKLSELEKKMGVIEQQLSQEVKLAEELKSQILANKKNYDQAVSDLNIENQRLQQAEIKLKFELDHLKTNPVAVTGTSPTQSAISSTSVSDEDFEKSMLEIKRLKLFIEENLPPQVATLAFAESSTIFKISEKVDSSSFKAISPDSLEATSATTNSDSTGTAGTNIEEVSGGPPPPPPPGPPPPPPPPPPPSGKKGAPAGPSAVQPTKPAINPSNKMKPLYWKRIILPPTGRQESFWDQVLEPTFDQKNFEDLFCQKKKEKKESEVDKESRQSLAVTPEKVKLISVIDIKKSNSIAFMLAKIPQGSEQLKNFIDQLDQQILNKELVKTLIGNVPSEQDYQLIKSSSVGDVVDPMKFDKPERWILEMYGFPAMRERLSSWLFLMEYQEMYSNIKTNLEKLSVAIELTKTNDNIKKLFGIVLVLGNYMNGGSSRGQADGFNLEILDAITNTKDIDGKQTLLDYIVKVSIDKYPKTGQIASELEPLKQVQLSISDIQTDFNDLETQFNIAKNHSQKALDILNECSYNNSVIQKFKNQVCQQLSAKTEDDISSLKEQQQKLVESYYKTLEFFGYTKAQITTVTCQQFFGTLFSFASQFSKIFLKLEKDREQSQTQMSKNESKKIASGADPVAALANAIKLGQGLRKRPQTNL